MGAERALTRLVGAVARPLDGQVAAGTAQVPPAQLLRRAGTDVHVCLGVQLRQFFLICLGRHLKNATYLLLRAFWRAFPVVMQLGAAERMGGPGIAGGTVPVPRPLASRALVAVRGAA
jgi:hypothetical protein